MSKCICWSFQKLYVLFSPFFQFWAVQKQRDSVQKSVGNKAGAECKKKVLVWSGNIMDLCQILGVMFMLFVLWNFCSIVQHSFLSGHQGILNLHLVNLPRGYQRQSVPEEASSRCADEAKIYTEFNNLNADTVLKAGVKICVYGT